jgi:hypothetical protein
MAKYKSLFEVRGDVGDAGFRRVNGQMILGRTSSIDKERMRTDPAFKRTRENQKEFGASAKAGKSLRMGLARVMKRFGDSRVTSRITKVFREMLKGGPGLRGQRTIEILNQKSKLIGLNLHNSDTFSSVCSLPIDLTVNVDRNTVTMNIPVFSADDYVIPPAGATHFKIVLAIAAVSDWEFDGTEQKYLPVTPEINGLGAVGSTAEIGVLDVTATPINLLASLPNLPVLGLTEGLMALVGIEFYQDINGQLYFFNEANAMHIEMVF